uniref:Scm-like with four MBT domains protein 1 n=1 Tax=Sipha flava TaxID=143950 RepID=A0A2S2R5G4_9HEMI
MLYISGWAKKHNFLLKPPFHMETSNIFCWSEYGPIEENLKLAFIDTTLKKDIDHSYIDMKLEAVDPVEPNCIRIATIKGFADHWMFLSFDRSTSTQEFLHVRSVYSDEVFPVGWCDKHNYPLTTPKCPYVDYDYNDNCYYASDVEIDFKAPDKECLIKYPNYFKGEFFYHYSKCYRLNSNQQSKEKLEMFIKNFISNLNCSRSAPVVSFTVNDRKNSLKLDINAHHIIAAEKDIMKRKNKIFKNNTKILNMSERNMCVYFNKSCYSGVCIKKKRIANLPRRIGPGPVPKVLQDVITTFVSLNYNPIIALKKIKNIQKELFDGPGGVELFVTTHETLKNSDHSENLCFPESVMMAQKYCSSLCNLFGICEYFMTTKNKQCSYGCSIEETSTSELNLELGTVPKILTNNKRKTAPTDLEYSNYLLQKRFIKKYKEIIEVAGKELDWSNEPLVKRFKYYMGCIINYEAISVMLDQNLSPHESAVVVEIQKKKNTLRVMDEVNIFSNTKTELTSVNNENRLVFDNWKSFFENCYRNDSRFKDYEIDIGNFQTINVTSNPKYWSPKDVYVYLLNDPCCKSVGDLLFNEEIDGKAFMLLNEGILMQNFQCSINLAIRLMCHVAQVNHVFLKEYHTQD